jgi:hypothetical protein
MRQSIPRPAGRWSAAPTLLGLLLAVAVLAGCQPAGSDVAPAPPPPAPPPTTLAGTSQPTAGPDTPAGGCDEPLSSVGHQVEGPLMRRFRITRTELAVIGSHLIDVLCRQGLWKKNVGFGVSYQTDSDHAIVLVNPGRSGLTARQMLDRLLGRG